MAVAISANGSAVSWGPSLSVSAHGYGYPAAVSHSNIVQTHAPAWAPAAWGSSAWAPGAWNGAGAWHGAGAWGAPVVASAWGHGPAVVAAHAPAVLAVPEHSGSYVAANRGSVHKAPLPGHITSVKSINVQPAPGTTW